MKKKFKYSIILSLLSVILMSSTALAAYSATIIAQNTSATNYGMIGLTQPASVAYMAGDGDIFANIEGLDTRVKEGTTPKPHLLATDRINFATILNANSSKTLNFTTNSSNLGSFKIIPGYSNNSSVGYIKTANNTTLKISNNGTIGISGFLASGDIINKNGALRLSYNATTENLTYSTYLADNISYLVQNNSVQSLQSINASRAEIFTINQDMYVTHLMFYALKVGAPGNLTFSIRPVTANLPHAGSGSDIASVIVTAAEVAVAPGTVVTKALSTPVTLLPGTYAICIKVATANVGNHYSLYNDNMFGYAGGQGAYTADDITWNTQATIDYYFRVTGTWNLLDAKVTATLHDIKIVSNTTDTKLYIDNILRDTAGIVNITNTLTDWIFMAGNSVAYADNISISVNGTRQLYYCPNTIIVSNGTTGILPDKETTTNNDGTIYWGGNPNGITLNLGMLESDYEMYVYDEEKPQDIMPAIPGKETNTDAARRAALSSHFLFPVVEAIETATGNRFTVSFQYQIGLAVISLVLFIVGYFFLGENLIIGGILSILPLAYGVTIKAYDWWVIPALVLWLVGCAITEGRRIIS